ncbi:Uncharacterised protein [Candidatus Tiddalikarchaeum anstoanum]|nr:Uncharacterised protein [Candidatus Tiddalikarchaeum anstoanum]
MMKKCQASFEFLLIIGFVVLITAAMNNIFFQKNLALLLASRSIDSYTNCEGFSSAVTEAARLNNMRIKIYNYYNMTVNSSGMLIVSYYNYNSEESFCSLQTKKLVNEAGSGYFNLTDGYYYITNHNGTLKVEAA